MHACATFEVEFYFALEPTMTWFLGLLHLPLENRRLSRTSLFPSVLEEEMQLLGKDAWLKSRSTKWLLASN